MVERINNRRTKHLAEIGAYWPNRLCLRLGCDFILTDAGVAVTEGPRRSLIVNAFLPATEVEDPSRFAGRAEEVRRLADGLHQEGSVPLVYGERGLGKSSLALQIRRIALGDVELLSQMSMAHLVLAEGERFLTFYVSCTGATRTLADLLQRLINSVESVDLMGPARDGGKFELVDKTTSKKLTFKLFELGSTKKYQTEASRLSYQDLSQEEKLVQLCDMLSSVYEQRVLIIVDEIDLLGDPSGLGAFLKMASSSNLKFLLVGIGGSIAELLDDHQSIERSLLPVSVEPMGRDELVDVVRKAEVRLRDGGVAIRFDRVATDRLAEVADGFPWFVHVLGRTALVDAYDRGDQIVSEGDIALAVFSIVNNEFAQHFHDQYQLAVRESPYRECVLRAYAHWPQKDIPLTEINRTLKGTLGVANPSAYRAHLCQAEYGRVLYTPAFQKMGLVRFRNEMFRSYVRMRPSYHVDVDGRVRSAFGYGPNRYILGE